MLDLRLIREQPDVVRAALARRGEGAAVDELLALDTQRRAVQTQVDEARSERNRIAQAVGEAKRAGQDAGELIARTSALKDGLSVQEARLADLDERLRERLLGVSNLPDESASEGMGEEDGRIERTVGSPPAFSFEPRDHVALAGPLIDSERGARTSGSRFAYLLGDLVRLHLATAQWALAKLADRGFTPVLPPVLVREEALVGTGFFPEARDQIYALPGDELFLVGTSEVSLAALHQGELLDETQLPLRYCGYSSCFRREAGAAGRDLRGIFRTHQFDKLEMFTFCHPEESRAEHERLLSIEEELARELGLHYQVRNVAVGDLGAPAAKKYDIEVWLPGQGRFRELTSCSNTTDYQARRLNARFRPAAGGAPRPLHTLNGTAITSSRTLIALLETHQRADGSVAVPEVLHAHGAPHEIRASG